MRPPLRYPGASYIDAWPSGEFAVLYPWSRIETHVGRVDFPAGERFGLMFLHCTPAGRFRFARLAHDLGMVCEWRQIGGWQLPRPPVTGRLVYDADGVIHDASPAGYQYVDEATGLPVSRIDTYGPRNGLSEWCVVADLQIGQVHDS